MAGATMSGTVGLLLHLSPYKPVQAAFGWWLQPLCDECNRGGGFRGFGFVGFLDGFPQRNML